ncbi:SPOR domain-containing protein [Cereibacter sphaeroides]|nr:SPOR domain-containing protein [Cereibacter sphaeroides]
MPQGYAPQGYAAPRAPQPVAPHQPAPQYHAPHHQAHHNQASAYADPAYRPQAPIPHPAAAVPPRAQPPMQAPRQPQGYAPDYAPDYPRGYDEQEYGQVIAYPQSAEYEPDYRSSDYGRDDYGQDRYAQPDYAPTAYRQPEPRPQAAPQPVQHERRPDARRSQHAAEPPMHGYPAGQGGYDYHAEYAAPQAAPQPAPQPEPAARPKLSAGRAFAAVTAATQGAVQGAVQGAAQGAAQNAGRMGRMVNMAGALVSVALVVGVGLWSYRLMVRDVTGVPVIRALAGPARISPEDPGGRQAAYQGLAVNTVAAEGGAGGAAESIALAPQPVSLTEEDRSTSVLAARAQDPITAPPPALNAAPGATGTGAAVQLAAATSQANPPLDLIPASRGGISRSPFPRARGGTMRSPTATPAVATTTIAAVAPVAPATPSTTPGTSAATGAAGSDAQAEALLQQLVTRLGSPRTTEIDPATLTPGTRLVQLGVYDDAATARAAWDQISARFPSFLEDRGRIVESASSGGRVFYRLRAAGFSDEPEARRFCTMLMAESVDCIPTLIR